MWPKLGCFAVNIGLKYAVMFLGLLNNELCSAALLESRLNNVAVKIGLVRGD